MSKEKNLDSVNIEKTFAVKKKAYAMALIKEGFELINVKNDKNNDDKLVYIFVRTEKFVQRFKELSGFEINKYNKDNISAEKIFENIHNAEIAQEFKSKAQALVDAFSGEFNVLLDEAIRNGLIKYRIF